MGVQFAEAATIAARQHGRITTQQLIACGFSKKSIERAVRAGRLHRVHRGVYAVGHVAPSRLGDWMGAVLACGSAAWLSHRCAATAYGIRDGVGPRIDVTIPGTSGRRRPGIAIHHADLETFEVGVWERIPITSPARTMVDLAHELRNEEAIEWMLRELQFRRLYDQRLLDLSNHRRPNRTLGRLLAGIEPTRSPLEVAFLHRVVRRHNLPTPEVNARPVGFLVDFLWADARVIAETDGRQHDDPLRKQADAARDAIHAEAGYLTLRYRWADVHRHDRRTATEIDHHLRIRRHMGV
jgi:very-short-patch-repair endonuclease